MIVDLEPAGRAAGPRVSGASPVVLVVGAILVGFAALLLRPAADPSETQRARERVLAAVPAAAPTATPTQATVVRAMVGPSVLARRTPRPALPPPLTLPGDVAMLVPAGTAEAAEATVITVRDTSRQVVYRVGDGRLFVLLQTPPDRRRVVMASYGLEEGTVRGQPAQFFTNYFGTLRSIVSWTEGVAGYHLYSTSLTIRDLVRLAEQLR